jgi:hypothetical protein
MDDPVLTEPGLDGSVVEHLVYIQEVLGSIPSLVIFLSLHQALDADEKHHLDGICFSDFGLLLSDRGFFKITQLSLKFIKLEQLAQWLGIKEGIVVLTFQYAEEDIEKFRASSII